MTTILDTIVEHKQMEVLKRKSRKPLHQLMLKSNYKREPLDPVRYFKENAPSIIAEFKRKSPSKGIISDSLDPVPVVKGYRKAGAIASSILTDRDFFGGSFKDLENVRNQLHDFPLLRKDFIIDSYQIHEAKAYGADIVLLIAAILSKEQVQDLSLTARDLGLSVLLEVHRPEECEKWNTLITLIGVNNRDLRNFSVDIERSVKLLPELPKETLKISESGLQSVSDVTGLYNLGYSGFLMGERFMKDEDPGASLADFINEFNV